MSTVAPTAQIPQLVSATVFHLDALGAAFLDRIAVLRIARSYSRSTGVVKLILTVDPMVERLTEREHRSMLDLRDEFRSRGFDADAGRDASGAPVVQLRRYYGKALLRVAS
jgi:hypothetical protein